VFGSSLTWGFRHTCLRKQNGEDQIPAVVYALARMLLINLCQLFIVHLLFEFRLQWKFKVTLLFERHIAAWTVKLWSSVCSIKVLPYRMVER